jgi:hypothetical protein
MTEDQIKVSRVIFTMVWQSIFSICVLIGWFIILFKLIDSKTNFDAIKYGAVETFLSGTMFLAFRYWFPISNKED